MSDLKKVGTHKILYYLGTMPLEKPAYYCFTGF